MSGGGQLNANEDWRMGWEKSLEASFAKPRHVPMGYFEKVDTALRRVYGKDRIPIQLARFQLHFLNDITLQVEDFKRYRRICLKIILQLKADRG